MKADSIVRARIPTETKDRVTKTLKAMGLNVSDLIRMTFIRVAEEGKIPFEAEVPNKRTQEAMAELEAGGGTKYHSVDAMFKDIGI